MRGCEARTGKLSSYVDLEARVPGEHPLRVIRGLADEVLAGMSSEFEAMYASTGRPSIPPERLLRALLLQAFYSIRSERQLMEQLNFTLLFRWFVGLGLDDPVWDASRFSHNRERFLAAEIAHRLLAAIATHRRVRRLLSRDHFSVDGTQIQAWASVKSFRPRGDGEAGGDGSGSGAETKGEGAEAESGAAGTDGGATGRNRARDFHGERWSNETHARLNRNLSHPYHCARYEYEGTEVYFSSVVSSGDAPEMLELVETAFDPVALFSVRRHGDHAVAARQAREDGDG